MFLLSLTAATVPHKILQGKLRQEIQRLCKNVKMQYKHTNKDASKQ